MPLGATFAKSMQTAERLPNFRISFKIRQPSAAVAGARAADIPKLWQKLHRCLRGRGGVAGLSLGTIFLILTFILNFMLDNI
jgi:hypothetical protein